MCFTDFSATKKSDNINLTCAIIYGKGAHVTIFAD